MAWQALVPVHNCSPAIFSCISSSDYKRPMLWFNNNNGHTEGGVPVVPCHGDKCVYNDAQTKREKIDRRIAWYGAKQSGNEPTWAVMALIDSIVLRYKRFDRCNGFIWALDLSTFISYILLYLSIILSLTPKGCALVWEYVPNFSHWVFGFSNTVFIRLTALGAY